MAYKKNFQLSTGLELLESKKQGEIRDGNNILLVEDEPDVLLSFKTVLVSHGYNVDAFTDNWLDWYTSERVT